MRIGLELSRNLMTVRLAQAVGMENVAAYAERFGVYDDMPEHLSFALGAGETTLMQMVSAYAMFANGGRLIEPTLVDRIQDRRGNTIWRHDARICIGCQDGFAPGAPAPEPLPTGQQVMDPVTSYQIVSMLRGAVTRGTAARPFAGVDAVVAGKTGTTNDAKDVWFVGFTPQMAFGCYIGFDNPRPMGRSAFGGTLCAPMVAEFVRAAYADRVSGDFDVPEGVEFISVNRWTGRPADGGEAIAEVFRAGYGPDFAGGMVVGDGDFFFDGGDFPATLDDAPDVERPNGPARPAAPAIGGGFAAPGGLY
jgi:penicillin-binding protein 1A